jgi:hypothetical protein
MRVHVCVKNLILPENVCRVGRGGRVSRGGRSGRVCWVSKLSRQSRESTVLPESADSALPEA